METTSVIRAIVTVSAFAALVCWESGCRSDTDLGLVAHYTFEEGPGETVKDRSGHGNHGRNFGADYVRLPHGRGYVLRFDAPDAHVDCGDKPSLDLTDAVTLELWFRPEVLVTKGEAGVMGKVMGSYCLAFSGNAWFYAPDGGSYSRSKPFSLDWHHLVATFDGGQVRMYCDGELQDVSAAKAVTLPHGGNFYLRYPATYDPPVEPALTCMMDDVRVYDRALSDAEVARRYRHSAKATGRHDVAWFTRPKLATHLFAQSSTVVVETNYTSMDLPAGPIDLRLELLKDGKAVMTHTQKVHALVDEDQQAERAEFFDVPMKGIVDWPVSVADLPDGDYVLRATLVDNVGIRIGESALDDLHLPLEKPDWIKAYDGVKIRNNMVSDLLNVLQGQVDAEHTYRFTNPRAGWIFISSTAAAAGSDSVSVSIDGEPIISHAHDQPAEQEAMRHVAAGEHTLAVRCSGVARPAQLIVRAIPELQVAGLGYRPAPLMPPFGHYNAEFLAQSGLLDNLNVIIERNALAEDAVYVADWVSKGKKMMTRYGMWPFYQMDAPTADDIFTAWTGDRGFQGEGYHGIIADEFSGIGHGGLGKYPQYTQAVKRIADDPRYRGRRFYPYCMAMHPSQQSLDMLKAVIAGRYKWTEEKYFTEQATEQAAWDYINLRFVRNTLRYEATFPGSARHMIMVPGYMSAPPETLDVYPTADFKVYMDMQMHVLANDPVLFGLYGVQWYHMAYTDEEILRFSGKLYRHYCIEGRTERMTNDPYMLAHLVNPDFVDGDNGWTLYPAEGGGIKVAQANGYGRLQTRVQSSGDSIGDHFLLTTRSAAAPNRFAQQIRNLTPGRTYSLRMFTADYDDIRQGKSKKQTHHINIKIDGADIIPEKTFHQLFASGQAGHAYPPFDRENNLYITFHRVVFRAAHQNAMLTVSDWSTDTDAGGPEGQELMHNFIQVQPYMDE